MSSPDPQGQIKRAIIILANQFEKESDLNEIDIITAIVEALNEWIEEDLIEFTPDSNS